MAKVSRETASHVEDIGVLESRSEEVDGTTIEFTSFREDADATLSSKVCPTVAARAGTGVMCCRVE